MPLRYPARRLLCLAALAASALLTGCDNMPGRPKDEPEVPVPASIVGFKTLYAQNCSGCHGDNGQHGAAIAMNNPAYLALVDDATLKTVIANGYKNGLMPGFSPKVAGLLTDEQINALVHGLRTTWGKGDVLAGLHAPAYAAARAGDVARGADVYASACASCHGAKGTENQRGSILNGSYLALMHPQSLRTIVITGRPEWGMPDWRGDRKGQPLTEDEVTDVVAWLLAQAPPNPGQPYASVKSKAPADPGTAAPSNGKGEKF